MDDPKTNSFWWLSPEQFESFVADYLGVVERWVQLRQHVQLAGFSVDIVGRDPQGNSYLVEVKHTAVLEVDSLIRESRRRDELKSQAPGSSYRVVCSGTLTPKARAYAQLFGLHVTDGAALLAGLSGELRTRWGHVVTPPPSKKSDQSSPPPQSPAASLRQALTAIPKSRAGFIAYQEWVRDVFEYLFEPPLGPKHYESEDASGRNRRDLILQNWAESGFWAQLRSEYRAAQVVVDAKNYAQPLSKRPVLDLAHYLKPYGTGLFGILVSPEGSGPAADHAMREEWIGGQRLILSLSNEDVLLMISMKERGERPEELLRQRIGAFRLAL